MFLKWFKNVLHTLMHQRGIRHAAVGFLEVLVCLSISSVLAMELHVQENDPEQQVILTFELNPSEIQMIQTCSGDVYESTIQIDGMSNIRPAGEDRLPVLGRLVRIADGKRAILNSSIEEAVLFELPSPLMISDGKDLNMFRSKIFPVLSDTILSIDPEILHDELSKEYTFAELGTPGIMRDIRVAHLSLFPFLYLGDNQIVAVTRARITISMDEGRAINPLTQKTNITH